MWEVSVAVAQYSFSYISDNEPKQIYSGQYWLPAYEFIDTKGYKHVVLSGHIMWKKKNV